MGDSIADAVRKSYGSVAREGLGSDNPGVRSVASAFGYSDEELASIPAEANMGLSCGNPVAMASLRPGETVVDLGCGGGLDVFLAARQVGSTGTAIGIDMTGDMISLARTNARKGNYDNVRFYLAEIEAMPIPSNSVDCVISNCVLNLCEDKPAALAEVFRILKPGGRLAISDIALKQPLPEEFRDLVAAWTGCIGGALTFEENRANLEAAGFTAIDIVDSHADLNAFKEAAASSGSDADAGCCAPASTGSEKAAGFHDQVSELLNCIDANEYAASVKIFALKPA
jgi:SAM-dependent methyltransferase